MNIVYRLRIAPSAMTARASLGSGGVTIPLLGRKQTMNEGCRGTKGAHHCLAHQWLSRSLTTFGEMGTHV